MREFLKAFGVFAGIYLLLILLILLSWFARSLRPVYFDVRSAPDLSRAELIGTWVADEASRQRLKDAGVSEHLSDHGPWLQLRDDGSCEYRGYWGSIARDAHPPYLTRQGTWTAKRGQMIVGYPESSQIIEMQFVLHSEPESESITGCKLGATKVGEQGVLWQWIGSAERPQYLELRRTAEPAPSSK